MRLGSAKVFPPVPNEAALVARHTPLVVKIAKRCQAFAIALLGRPMDMDDLVAMGMLGLVQALRRFDPSRGLQFSTIAWPYVSGYIKTGIKRESGFSITGADRGFGRRLFYASGQAPEDEDSPPSSIAVAPSREPTAHDVDVRLDVEQRLALLTPRQRNVVRWHAIDGVTLDDIAVRLAVTRERARQIYVIAMAAMRRGHHGRERPWKKRVDHQPVPVPVAPTKFQRATSAAERRGSSRRRRRKRARAWASAEASGL